MSGSLEGGRKAAATNRKKYGDDFFKRLGQMGGHRSHKGGFAANPELARIAGSKGGLISRRGRGKHRNKEADEEAKDKMINKNYEKMIKDFKAIRRASKYDQSAS